MFPQRLTHGLNFKSAVVNKINEIIDYLKTQRLVGDNKNIIVNQGTAGVSLQVRGINIGGSSTIEGGGGESFINFPVTVENNGTVNTSTVKIGAGTYLVDGETISPSGVDLPLSGFFVNYPTLIYGLYDRDAQGYAKTSFVIGLISDPSFKAFPIATVNYTTRLGSITSVTVNQICRSIPYLTAYRQPWEVYIGNYTNGERIGNTLNSNCRFYMEDGLAPSRLEFPITPKSWNGVPIADVPTSQPKILYYKLTRSDHELLLESDSSFANNTHYAWNRENHIAYIPIALLENDKITQAQIGNFYGVEGQTWNP